MSALHELFDEESWLLPEVFSVDRGFVSLTLTEHFADMTSEERAEDEHFAQLAHQAAEKFQSSSLENSRT